MPRPWILDAIAPPFRRRVLSTPHSLDTVRTALSALLVADGEFQGRRDGDRFKLVRCINYRNGFLPVFSVELRPSISGVELHLSARPAILAFISWSLWMSVAIAFLALALSGALRDGDAPATPIPPLLLVTFGWLLASLGFGLEARYGVRLIAEAVGAEP